MSSCHKFAIEANQLFNVGQSKNHMLYYFDPLGFLNANVDRFSKSPANYGLMDILAALHWIQENIEAFGGDSKSVTLAGHGTGAACVHFLIASQAVSSIIAYISNKQMIHDLIHRCPMGFFFTERF